MTCIMIRINEKKGQQFHDGGEEEGKIFYILSIILKRLLYENGESLQGDTRLLGRRWFLFTSFNTLRDLVKRNDVITGLTSSQKL